jgi:hypothetical protein
MVEEGRVDNQLEDGRGVVQKKATEITRFRQQFRAEHLIGEQESTAPPQHQKGVPLKEEKESKEWNDFGASSAVTRSRTPVQRLSARHLPRSCRQPLVREPQFA